MSTTTFTLTYNSHASGHTEKKSITAKNFYIEQGCVFFVGDDDRTMAAYPWGRVDSIETDAVKDVEE